MIAKHVSMKSVKKSDFAGLVKYITDEQSKNERVGCVTVSNCQSDKSDVAIIEVLNTQAQNKRAISDKTYHLIVSFRTGEQPDDATLKAIESRICDGLGYCDHQRISAVHYDTDNLHIHIAINKIHPTRYTIHSPYNDYKYTLGQLCEKLEREFGLESDNHQVKKCWVDNRAADMESHAGIESLLGWIKRECLEQIKGAQSWKELHQVMRDSGLDLRERGNGLIVLAENGTIVKASSIDRDLSKGKLESRFGAFESSIEQSTKTAVKPVRQYEKLPIQSGINTVELYAKYQVEQKQVEVLRTAEWLKARDRKNRQIEVIKQRGRLKRSAIKLMVDGRISKKVLYAATSKSIKDEIKKINKSYLVGRQEIYEKYQRLAWVDWLRVKAIKGDDEALGALRARHSSHGLKGNIVTGKGSPKSAKSHSVQDGITKKGTIIYRVGSTAVRDDGDKLNVSRGANQEGLQTVLHMAIERYGDRITVNGTAEFKEQIVQAAAAARLSITFDDVGLEVRRKNLLNHALTKESIDEYARANRRRADSSRNGSIRFTTTRDNLRRSRSNPADSVHPGSQFSNKPNLARIGRKPPPQSQYRLRGLSELGVVYIDNRSEVLLSSNVPGYLEQQGTKPDNRMRRGIFGSGSITDGFLAADKYIAERQNKRLELFDIPNHIRYSYCNEGVTAFAGIRQVDGQTLALLKHGENIMVLPIDVATARNFKRIAVGDVVTVTLNGSIKIKGRSR